MNKILAKYTELSDEILSDEDYDANEGSNTFNSFEATKKRKCEISSTNDKNNNDQATLSTLISSSPKNNRNAQNATSHVTVSLLHDIDAQFINYFVISPTIRRNVNAPNLAEQSHASSLSNIISASNANALHVGNTLQYDSNSMRVHHIDEIGIVNQIKISKYDLVFM
ncbi:1668_t:CDS:2, partial [Racocetra persica]